MQLSDSRNLSPVLSCLFPHGFKLPMECYIVEFRQLCLTDGQQ